MDFCFQAVQSGSSLSLPSFTLMFEFRCLERRINILSNWKPVENIIYLKIKSYSILYNFITESHLSNPSSQNLKTDTIYAWFNFQPSKEARKQYYLFTHSKLFKGPGKLEAGLWIDSTWKPNWCTWSITSFSKEIRLSRLYILDILISAEDPLLIYDINDL